MAWLEFYATNGSGLCMAYTVHLTALFWISFNAKTQCLTAALQLKSQFLGHIDLNHFNQKAEI